MIPRLHQRVKVLASKVQLAERSFRKAKDWVRIPVEALVAPVLRCIQNVHNRVQIVYRGTSGLHNLTRKSATPRLLVEAGVVRGYWLVTSQPARYTSEAAILNCLVYRLHNNGLVGALSE